MKLGLIILLPIFYFWPWLHHPSLSEFFLGEFLQPPRTHFTTILLYVLSLNDPDVRVSYQFLIISSGLPSPYKVFSTSFLCFVVTVFISVFRSELCGPFYTLSLPHSPLMWLAVVSSSCFYPLNIFFNQTSFSLLLKYRCYYYSFTCNNSKAGTKKLIYLPRDWQLINGWTMTNTYILTHLLPDF